MKHYFSFILLFLFCSAASVAQKYSFAYDKSGNRIERKIIQMQMSPKTTTHSTTADSTEIVELQPEPIRSTLERFELLVYPNPTQGKLKVEIKGEQKIETAGMMLFSADGKPIYTNRKTEKSYELDISSYPNGIYIMQLVLNGQPYEWKIIKE